MNILYVGKTVKIKSSNTIGMIDVIGTGCLLVKTRSTCLWVSTDDVELNPFKIGDMVKYNGIPGQKDDQYDIGTIKHIVSFPSGTFADVEWNCDTLGIKVHPLIDLILIKEYNIQVCECGKEKHGFASHIYWCAMDKVG